tara:strand:- start:22487 stop:24253 length:1767 start_codon:yes stop_codon:yes gene_type:complete
MTQIQDKASKDRVIPILPEELEEFENEVKRFQAGEWNTEHEFMAFRLRQGVYGQRQADVQMVRVKAPFGGLTADQLGALSIFADKYTPLRKGHITTRENIQFHHVKLEDAAAGLHILAEVGLSTREACGNTVRNVTGCPMAGVCPDEPFDVTPYAAAYARYFVRHPFSQSMPRKIKSAFSDCESDCAITAIHDVGFIPKIKEGIKGFKMVMGGGTSIMPRLAPTLYEFVSENEYLKVTEAAIRVFHKSNELRRNRMKARVKFLIDRIGIDEFRKLVEKEMEGEWAQKSFDPKHLLFIEDEMADAPKLDADFKQPSSSDAKFEEWCDSNVATQKQTGYHAATVKVKLGDLSVDQFQNLANLSRRFAGGRCRITHQQNLTFRWVPKNALYELWSELDKIGLGDSGVHQISDVVSCPGTDSCKLGITSSMGLARALESIIEELNIDDPLVKKMHVKMSGCPNGCGQHHIADIGFHGAAAKAPGGQVPAYELFLGGSYAANDARFGIRVKAKIPAKNAPDALKKIIQTYMLERSDNEEFKDFALRFGSENFEEVLQEFKDVGELNRDTLPKYMDWDKTIKYVLERGEGECMV